MFLVCHGNIKSFKSYAEGRHCWETISWCAGWLSSLFLFSWLEQVIDLHDEVDNFITTEHKQLL